MSYADKVYKDLFYQIHYNGDWDYGEEVRTKYADGETAYAKSIFGYQVKFPKGIVPLITTKKVFTQTAIKEMILFWVKQTVKKDDFDKWNVKIWDEWMNSDGNLGDAYASQFEKRSEDLIIVEDVKYSGELATNEDFINRKTYNERKGEKLYNVWKGMLNRCYNKNSDKYKSYGAVGVTVAKSWIDYDNFLKEVVKIPHYFSAKKDDFIGWEIDKDYFNSNTYSKDTCVWLKTRENKTYTSSVKPLLVTFYSGKSKKFLSQSQVCEEYGLSRSSLSRDILKKDFSSKRYSSLGIKSVETLDENLRRELGKNQVVELINNIKKTPKSRRLMTSFWDFENVEKKALQECAWATQWDVRNGDLNLILIQRSVDFGNGVVFNWWQYYVLQCLIARCCNLEVGEFIHQMGNVHYYDRHEDLLLEQMKEPIYDNDVKVLINESLDDFFKTELSDIVLENFKCSNKKYVYEIAI